MEKTIEKGNRSKSYVIFDYLKSNPSIVIALLSLVIAGVTAILNFFAHIIQKQYLNYWNISITVMANDSKDILYQLCASILLCFSFSFTMLYMNKIFENYFSEVNSRKQVKMAQRILHKQVKRIVHRFGLLQFRRKFYKIFERFYKLQYTAKYIDNLEIELNNLGKEVNDCQEKMEKAKKHKPPAMWRPLIKLTAIIVLISLYLFAVIFLCFMILSKENNFLYISAILTILFVFFYSLFGYIGGRLTIDKKEIRKIVKEYLNGETEWKYTKYVKSYEKKQIKEYFSDESLKGYAIIWPLLILLVFILAAFNISTTFDVQKDFYITTYNDEYYAAMYRSGDKLVLEKADIDGATIIIDTSNQVIVKEDNMIFEYRVFDNAQRKAMDGENK